MKTTLATLTKSIKWRRVRAGWYCMGISHNKVTVTADIYRDADTDPWKIVTKVYANGTTLENVTYLNNLKQAKTRVIAVTSEWM